MFFMAGVNYKNNNISQREKLSFTFERIIQISQNICGIEGVWGCIILSTCNRTEIYLSMEDVGENISDKFLLEYSKIQEFDGVFEKREGEEVVYYIMELACGIKSQIMGEEQIVSQINHALEISRENGCTDSALNTLFRIAVSAGKYALTNVKISNTPVSSAYAAVKFLSQKYENLKNKKCVIIGNGKMGQIAQKLLVKKGCMVFVTLRSYKHGNNDIVKGCIAIKYKERYNYIDGTDFVISATKSPHYTLTYDKFKDLIKKPDIVIDLAVPRDVEALISKECECFNIDEFGYKTEISSEKIDIIYGIVEKFTRLFFNWENYKMSLQSIEELKDIISRRIVKSEFKFADSYKIDNVVAKTVDKTVDMLLGGMKDYISPDIIDLCKKKVRERARL